MFRKFANEHMVLFDGAMGTSIQKQTITDHIWNGKNGCNEYLNLADPQIIYNIHKKYFEAGANVAVTNTFGAIKSVLSEYGLEDKVAEINIKAVEIARDAGRGFDNAFVSLSIGPGTKLASLGHISYDELYDQYLEQVLSVDADLYNIETAQDLLQMRAAVNACVEADKTKGKNTPIFVSFTVEQNNALLTGSDVSAVASVMRELPIFALGLNCSLGPDLMETPFAKLSALWSGSLYLSPNAGLPEVVDGKTVYQMDGERFAQIMQKLVEKYPLNYIGGCCGTDEMHISALRRMIDNNENKFFKHPNRKSDYVYLGGASSLYSETSLTQTPPPAMIGERSNATGSKLFRDKLLTDDKDGVIAICKNQEDEGAHFIDLSVAYAGRNEINDYSTLVPLLNTALTAPLVIDSTDSEAVLATLKRCSGKPIINSVNLEDGGAKLHKIFDMVKKHPACMVALTIDEDGMAQTAAKKLEIAKRLYNIWVKDYGRPPEDLIIDPLTFSIGSGDENLRYAALETLEAIRLIKTNLKGAKTVLGLSNVSFGLSTAARPILNSVFMDMAVKAGLDMAIVHASKLIPINSLSEGDVLICYDLINAKDNALEKFIEHFSNFKQIEVVLDKTLPPLDALAEKIKRGDKSGIETIINDALKENSAEDIINLCLFPAMQKIGELFGEGKMLLPFVLKSAETMKAAVSILEPKMKKKKGGKKGTVVIATVQGDVHDIGKNLVDIIMSNNGFHVHNLGIKVPVAQMITKAIEVNADAIGMSGLLVKSTHIMKDNLEEIAKALPHIKIMLGGAALTNKFVNETCAPIMPDKVYYCSDAFDNIGVMNGKKQPAKPAENKTDTKKVTVLNDYEKPKAENIPTPPFFGVKSLKLTLDDITPYINKKALFSNAWGYKQKNMTNDEYAKLIQETAYDDYETLIAKFKRENVLDLKCRYGYFKVKSRGIFIDIFNTEGGLLYSLEFPNRKLTPNYSLADFISSDEFDILPLQVVTLGDAPVKFCEKMFKGDSYKDYYIAHGLFTAITEGFAEAVHAVIRSELGFDDGQTTMDGILNGNYRSKRYSFGYPLAPNTEYNKVITTLLETEKIGVEVNETNQMNPEYTTSAFIIHHSKAGY